VGCYWFDQFYGGLTNSATKHMQNYQNNIAIDFDNHGGVVWKHF
jgi:hypothetical protein